MALVVSSELGDLSKLSGSNVCVIKNVLDRTLCDELVQALEAWRADRSQNQDRGENWWYRVSKEGSEFDSFLFFQLHKLEPGSLRTSLLQVYRRLYDAHVLCGTVPDAAKFEDLLLNRDGEPSFEPLVFFYKPGTGRFQRHAHEALFQKTQVLINVTKRSRDYLGGETLIEETDGNVVELGEVFDQGDLFSFPYSSFHSVNPVLAPAKGDGIGRMSILMPFNARGKSNILY